MPHLPNEIWLQIASYCSPPDLWLSLRHVNVQLSLCAEQHFTETFLPSAILTLPIKIPTYDMRNPRRGNIIFKIKPPPDDVPGLTNDESRICLVMVSTDPESYAVHFLDRWKGMQQSRGGEVNARLQWELGLCGRSSGVHLKDPVAVVIGRDGGGYEDETWVSFEWRPTVTRFLRDHRDLVREVGLI